MTNKGTTLYSGGYLAKNDYLTSQNQKFRLILQDDGNLVIYRLAGYQPTWASNTAGQAVNVAVMQGDGNFVIYGYPGAIWASNTDGKGNCFLTMQDDGNLVIYEVAAPVWASQG